MKQRKKKQKRLSKDAVLRIIRDIRFQDRTFLLLDKGDGWLLQMEYMEADVEYPENGPVRQSTRKWYISPYMTTSEIVETCWACVCRSQIHVASEHFTYRGRRVYSQHFDVWARMGLCDSNLFDKRIDF